MKIENHPKHRQIYDAILSRIESGELKEGDKLPSEQDMAREFGVAYMTMRVLGFCALLMFHSGENRVPSKARFSMQNARALH